METKNEKKGKEKIKIVSMKHLFFTLLGIFAFLLVTTPSFAIVAPPISIILRATSTPTPTMCGGIRGLSCPVGYQCIYSNGTTRAPFPDASGTCKVATTVPKATITPTPTMCGGIMAIPCGTGYECIYSNGTTRAPFPDASGTCKVATTIPKTTVTPTPTLCGGFQGLICSIGYECIYTDGTTHAPFPDASGTCQPAPSSKPQSCNMRCSSNADCASGYCYHPPMPTCAAGVACPEVMPISVCRNLSCTNSVDCSCTTPSPCIPRPACLDATPACLVSIPAEGWCPTTPTPATKRGDANSDNSVDGKDYIIWIQNYNTTVSLGASKGDFDENGTVDGKDFIVWLTNYGL